MTASSATRTKASAPRVRKAASNVAGKTSGKASRPASGQAGVRARGETRVRASGGEVISRRALNRALLARQLLLRRETRSAADTIELLVGMQAQIPENPYIALFARLEGFRHEELGELITSRRALRMSLMRFTIHLVTARDALALRPVMQPVLIRSMQGTFGRRLMGLDHEAIVSAGRALMGKGAITTGALGAQLASLWPGRDPLALATLVRAHVPSVQVPPRGVWGASAQASQMALEAFLRRKCADEASEKARETMVLRYLAAFGPASVMDAQAWCGLTKLRDVIEKLRPRLRSFRDEKGRELFDLPDAPRPDADTPAPPRFLPEYDNIALSHADRSRIFADDHRSSIFTGNGMQCSFLLDGFIAGGWKIVREGKIATLTIAPFARPSKTDRAALLEEGERLLAFTDGDAARRRVTFVSSAQRDS